MSTWTTSSFTSNLLRTIFNIIHGSSKCYDCMRSMLNPRNMVSLSRKSHTIFGQGTIPEPSTSHIGKGVALVARTAALVYSVHIRQNLSDSRNDTQLPHNILRNIRCPNSRILWSFGREVEPFAPFRQRSQLLSNGLPLQMSARSEFSWVWSHIIDAQKEMIHALQTSQKEMAHALQISQKEMTYASRPVRKK